MIPHIWHLCQALVFSFSTISIGGCVELQGVAMEGWETHFLSCFCIGGRITSTRRSVWRVLGLILDRWNYANIFPSPTKLFQSGLALFLEGSFCSGSCGSFWEFSYDWMVDISMGEDLWSDLHQIYILKAFYTIVLYFSVIIQSSFWRSPFVIECTPRNPSRVL